MTTWKKKKEKAKSQHQSAFKNVEDMPPELFNALYDLIVNALVSFPKVSFSALIRAMHKKEASFLKSLKGRK